MAAGGELETRERVDRPGVGADASHVDRECDRAPLWPRHRRIHLLRRPGHRKLIGAQRRNRIQDLLGRTKSTLEVSNDNCYVSVMALAASTARPRTAHPARDLCLAPGRTIDAPVVQGGRYGRMFPDGETVARALGATPLNRKDLALGGWDGDTPLWLYILREAAVQGGGDRLGAVGGRIVAEVLVEIVRQDPEPYLSSNPSWRPTLPSHQPRIFKIRDLLVLAG